MNFEHVQTDQYEIVHTFEDDVWTLSGLARDVDSQALVFLKAKDGNRESLAREAALLANLGHPQIPKLVESGVDADIPYIVTEFLGHPRSPHKLTNMGPAPEMAARLCLSALQPLEYLHQEGVTHRDVKTPNLIMRMSGWAGLVDFELSIRDDEQDFQPEGEIWGTADYIAPERALGKRGDARSDVYGMGIVMYELLYGRLPFHGDREVEVARQHVNAEISYDDCRVPNALAAIVKRATRKDPVERYESATAMRQELAGYLETTE